MADTPRVHTTPTTVVVDLPDDLVNTMACGIAAAIVAADYPEDTLILLSHSELCPTGEVGAALRQVRHDLAVGAVAALILTPRCARELGRALLAAADHLTAPTTSDLLAAKEEHRA